MKNWLMMWMVLRRLLLYSHLFWIAKEDARTKKIPGRLLKSFLWKGCVLLVLEAVFCRERKVFFFALAGFFTGGGLLFLLYVVTRRRIGAGDVKLFAVAGLCVGGSRIRTAVCYTFFLAGIEGLFLLLSGREDQRKEIPLAPFCLAGILLADLLGA